VAEPSFLDEAIEEVVAAVAHHELVSAPGTAQRLFLEAKSVIQQVLESPRRWPVEENGYRRWRLDAFPYSWRYEVSEAGEVRFVAFVHSKRRPGYFERRTQTRLAEQVVRYVEGDPAHENEDLIGAQAFPSAEG
jgi:hypothetical protein